MHINIRISFLQILSAFIFLSAGAPLQAASPIPPSLDEWYTSPSNFELASPGDVLRVRSAPGNLTTIYSNSSAAYNILYRTTDSNYYPAWAVTTLLVPQEKSNNGALLSYQIPYNSADVDASPSYYLYQPTTELSSIQNSDVQTLLGFGYYVSIPDFEGPLASFTDGLTEGYAVLDAVRTVLVYANLSADARYALWGFSGGSFASGWAAELQPQYAPELRIAGVALGGFVPNISDIYPAVTSTRWAALLPESIVGITTLDQEAYHYLLSQLKSDGPFNETGFLSVKDMTIEEAFSVFGHQNIYQYFESGEAFFDAPVIKTLLDRKSTLGYHGIPETPLFIYQAVADEITHIQNTERLIERYCSVGVDILFERNTVGGHLAEMTNGDHRALQWLQTVLGCQYRHQGCTIRDVAVNVTDSPL